jgi:hypothetical protein
VRVSSAEYTGVVARKGTASPGCHGVGNGGELDSGLPWWQELWEEWMDALGDTLQGQEESPTEEAARREVRLARERASASRTVNHRPASSRGSLQHAFASVGDAVGPSSARSGGATSVSPPVLENSDDEGEEEAARALYGELLNRAERTDLATLAEQEMVYRSGDTVKGHPSIVLVGSRIHDACNAPVIRASAAREAVALLLLRETKAIMARPFVIVFLATHLPDDSGPTFDFLRTLLLSLPISIHKQLAGFYLVHPTLKMRFTFTILGAVLWGKVRYIDELRQLREFFRPGKLLVPEFVAVEDDHRLARRGGLLVGEEPTGPSLPRTRDLGRHSTSHVGGRPTNVANTPREDGQLEAAIQAAVQASMAEAAVREAEERNAAIRAVEAAEAAAAIAEAAATVRLAEQEAAVRGEGEHAQTILSDPLGVGYGATTPHAREQAGMAEKEHEKELQADSALASPLGGLLLTGDSSGSTGVSHEEEKDGSEDPFSRALQGL